MIKRREKKHITVFSAILFALLVVYTVSLFGLLLWGFVSSFKVPRYFNDYPYILPSGWAKYAAEWTNGRTYETKWTFNILTVIQNFKLHQSMSYLNNGVLDLKEHDVYIYDMFLYSMLYALGCATAATLVPCATAYVCARYPFKFSKILHSVVLVVMIIPLVGNLPSELQMVKSLGLYDKIYGLWIMKANFLGLYFLVFYNLFRAFPASYFEAAKVDGANNFTIMTKIAFPLIRNTFATVMLINFINFWNDYQIPLMYMPYYPTMSKGLYDLMHGTAEKEFQNTPYRLSAAILVIVPVLLLFLAFQKRLLGNLTAGGVKG